MGREADGGAGPRGGGARVVADEVRTRRLVVEDADGVARLVGEVRQGTTELRLELPGTRPGASTAVVLFATPVGGGGAGDRYGLGPALGVQLWADGEALAELDAWPEGDGRWRAHLHVHGG